MLEGYLGSMFEKNKLGTIVPTQESDPDTGILIILANGMQMRIEATSSTTLPYQVATQFGSVGVSNLGGVCSVIASAAETPASRVPAPAILSRASRKGVPALSTSTQNVISLAQQMVSAFNSTGLLQACA